MRKVKAMVELTLLPREQNALIIVSPFARLTAPELGVHILQACAREAGFQVRVLYANLMLAAVIGVDNYIALCMPSHALVGERFFAASAYDLPPFGYEPERLFTEETFLGLFPLEVQTVERLQAFSLAHASRPFNLDLPILKQLETQAGPWADAVAAAVVDLKCPIVGCTIMNDETDGRWLLRDTRRLPGTTERLWLTRRQAALVLAARPFEPSAEIEWAQRVGGRSDISGNASFDNSGWLS